LNNVSVLLRCAELDRTSQRIEEAIAVVIGAHGSRVIRGSPASGRGQMPVDAAIARGEPVHRSASALPQATKTYGYYCIAAPSAKALPYSSEALRGVDFGSSGSALGISRVVSRSGGVRLSKWLFGDCIVECRGGFARRISSTLLLPEQAASSIPNPDKRIMRTMTGPPAQAGRGALSRPT
jgi:hypothetical protein